MDVQEMLGGGLLSAYKKMASSDEKSLAVGHISGFQIDPNKHLSLCHNCGRGIFLLEFFNL